MASNKYGLPRPDMLDLTFCNVWINAPRGYEAHYDYDYRVIAVIQPINMLLIRKYKVLKEYKNGVRNEATDEYRLVKIYDIDIYDLTDLVDDIKHQTLNFRPVWQTGFATEVNQFLDILKENRKHFDFKKGDEVCIQSWLCQGGDEYKRAKPYLTTIIDINDHRVIYNDPEGCGWNDSLYSLVPVNSPWCSYLGCQKQYKWQEEEEEEKYK